MLKFNSVTDQIEKLKFANLQRTDACKHCHPTASRCKGLLFAVGSNSIWVHKKGNSKCLGFHNYIRPSEFASLSKCSCEKDDSPHEDLEVDSTTTPSKKILRSENKNKSLVGRYAATQCWYCNNKSKGFDVAHSDKTLREILNGVH